MSDIFISYAHEDRQWIIPIANALEQAGFSVWWDREKQKGLRSGQNFRDVIEQELKEAACVIVCWTATSRKSEFVIDEASWGKEREVLTPVFLEKIKPPLGYGGLHTEDFTNWQGNQKDECWQLLILQTEALKLDAQKTAPVTASPITTEPTALNYPTSRETIAVPNQTRFNAGSAFLSTTLPLMAAAWFLGNGPQMGIMGLTGTIALMAFLLMRQADRDLHPHMKALTTRWLMPQEGRAQVNMPEGFLRLFEAVFGRKHWSWHCIWRSAIASTLGLVVMLVVFDYFQTNGSLFDLVKDEVAIMVIIAVPANIIGDYLSLWETRSLLRLAARRPTLLPLLVLLDVLLTFFIWLAGIALPAYILTDAYNEASIVEFGGLLIAILELSLQGLLAIFSDDTMPTTGILSSIAVSAMLATSYITSVWLWLVMLVTPVVRALLWSRTSGLSTLGRVINTQQKPFTALGYLMSLIIMIIGTTVWGLSFL